MGVLDGQAAIVMWVAIDPGRGILPHGFGAAMPSGRLDGDCRDMRRER